MKQNYLKGVKRNGVLRPYAIIIDLKVLENGLHENWQVEVQRPIHKEVREG